ncbi:Unknown protein sequence [Pseudomonas syringae pv. maculicola]|nr:Unknown protein sequence [Pseudomonas syringae pv. maculicola]
MAGLPEACIHWHTSSSARGQSGHGRDTVCSRRCGGVCRATPPAPSPGPNAKNAASLSAEAKRDERRLCRNRW